MDQKGMTSRAIPGGLPPLKTQNPKRKTFSPQAMPGGLPQRKTQNAKPKTQPPLPDQPGNYFRF
jgi:hypothetical protein